MIISDIINSFVAFTGLLTSVLTILIIKESRLMRKYYSTPEISVFLNFAEASPTLMFLHIENLGMGTAHNVNFKLIEDFKHYQNADDTISSKGIFNKTLQHFYPKQNFKYLIDSIHGVSDEELKDPIKILVTYNDDYGKIYERIFNLDIELYNGEVMMTPGDTHIQVISYRLQQIQKDFNNLTIGILNILKDKK